MKGRSEVMVDVVILTTVIRMRSRIPPVSMIIGKLRLDMMGSAEGVFEVNPKGGLSVVGD